ncbi:MULTISPECIES: D-glucuronyl C5-epimerase family protein [unclassified Knoellia]|uniref:D-glucuronyl C5-epimerase family protein n=1 Tax=Knoellia altitudinis TaxID=3404795 RepID=UPI003609ECC1
MNRRDLITGLSGAAAANVAAASSASAAPAQLAGTDYVSTGPYLDYLTRGNIAGGSNVRIDAKGVIQVQRGATWVYNPVTISQYGLQQFSYYRRDASAAALHKAVVQAGWLLANQEKPSGLWRYNYAFGVGGMSETLAAGWASAMAQGQAMSLLTRIGSAYPTKPGYVTGARLALQPLLKPVSQGGLSAKFHGLTYLEEYPTLTAPTFALNGFQFTLIGLWDLAAAGDSGARALFQECLATMIYALPHHDAITTSAYHLGHLTKPARKIHHAAHYHRIHVLLLDALQSVAPNAVITFYADLWRTYPAMDPSTW